VEKKDKNDALHDKSLCNLLGTIYDLWQQVFGSLLVLFTFPFRRACTCLLPCAQYDAQAGDQQRAMLHSATVICLDAEVQDVG